jgi:uncharacterized protein YcbX
MRVGALYIAPVKSLALQRVERARVTKRGLAGDREFFLATSEDKLFTMREVGPLATVRVGYDAEQRELAFTFPDGQTVGGRIVQGGPATVRFFNLYDVSGHNVPGPWDEALSTFAGRELRLVQAGDARSGVDALPVSLLSDASIKALRESSGAGDFEERRFRPNIFVTGADRAHVEDEWLGQQVGVGESVVHVRMRDPRCVMTTLHPDTGLHDHDTLKMITRYRTDQPKEVNFGVYGTVSVEGEIAIGDDIRVVTDKETE